MASFDIANLGESSVVPGMTITRDREDKTLCISPKNQVLSILERFGITDCNPVSTPGMRPEQTNEQPVFTLLNDAEQEVLLREQAILETLIYLSRCTTRCDICYAVVVHITQAVSKPSKVHMGKAQAPAQMPERATRPAVEIPARTFHAERLL